MISMSKDKRVSDMTAGELQELIRETVIGILDADYGLELKPEVEKELRESLRSRERIPAARVAQELGLKW